MDIITHSYLQHKVTGKNIYKPKEVLTKLHIFTEKNSKLIDLIVRSNINIYHINR